jgi:hypothetical protein
MTVSIQTAAGTTIAGLDNNMQVTPTPTPTPTPTQTPTPSPIPIPPATLSPTVPITNLQLAINTLFKTLMAQELSSVDQVELTTELERILDDLAGGQYQIRQNLKMKMGKKIQKRL